MPINDQLVAWLFATNALRVCPPDQPFWYTSGTIGPYYINSHFLYGSEESANRLLQLIDVEKAHPYRCPRTVLEATRQHYAEDAIYRGVIDMLCAFITERIDLAQVDAVSGGERRDWFFSLLAAELLGKPHITIYKNLQAVMASDGQMADAGDLSGQRVLHIADLITEASSYERAWIPAIASIGARLAWSVVIVDRKQGGDRLLASHGVESSAMLNIDQALFANALAHGLINDDQYRMILAYLADPKAAMKAFLAAHPDFLANALQGDPKTRERAALCVEKGMYA